jgi:phthalate 4,5-dioxygenase oxygenase subunit
MAPGSRTGCDRAISPACRDFVTEDAICVVTSGGDGIRDRSVERLSTADLAIGHIYRSLLRSARQVLQGKEPVGYGIDVRHVKGAHASLDPGTDWRSLVPEHGGRRKTEQVQTPVGAVH